MEGAIVVTWGSAVPGREEKGLEVFGKAITMCEEAAKKGRIHGHKEYFSLTGNASDLAGVQVIEGDVEQLQKMMIEDEWLQLRMETAEITQNFNVTVCAGGSDSTIQQVMRLYMKSVGTLGYL